MCVMWALEKWKFHLGDKKNSFIHPWKATNTISPVQNLSPSSSSRTHKTAHPQHTKKTIPLNSYVWEIISHRDMLLFLFLKTFLSSKKKIIIKYTSLRSDPHTSWSFPFPNPHHPFSPFSILFTQRSQSPQKSTQFSSTTQLITKRKPDTAKHLPLNFILLDKIQFISVINLLSKLISNYPSPRHHNRRERKKRNAFSL